MCHRSSEQAWGSKDIQRLVLSQMFFLFCFLVPTSCNYSGIYEFLWSTAESQRIVRHDERAGEPRDLETVGGPGMEPVSAIADVEVHRPFGFRGKETEGDS